jgi:hypothetical protein
MRYMSRRLGWMAALTSILGLGVLAVRPVQAQTPTITFPQWIQDSFLIANRYLALWEYFRGGQETRFNVWTGPTANPLDTRDDFSYFVTVDNNGNQTIVWPWGTRLISGQRPTRRGNNTGDDRPFANVLTLHVEDATATNGFTDYTLPDDGSSELGPPVVTLPNAQGFYSQYRVPQTPAPDLDFQVIQKNQFARDLMRIEVIIRNRTGTSRRVGARMLLDSYVDDWGPTRSVFLPKTYDRVLRETEFRAANMPEEWMMFDDDEGPDQVFIAKGILKGNGATPPSRVVFGNTLDLFPFVLNSAQYDWPVRPDWELRISDMGFLLYWDPITIPGNQTRTFVTYAGLGWADHGMSDAYIASQTGGTLESQGFIGAVQTPFALPLVNGDADTTEATVTAFLQNAFGFSMPNAFAFIDLPDGLQFGNSNPSQPQRLDMGSLDAVSNGRDEGSGSWTVQANGVEAGLLPIRITYGNGFQDSARAVRLMNVPQGRRYELTDDWKMITFPFTYAGLEDDPAVVLGLQPGTFQIVRFDPSVPNPETGGLGSYEQVGRIRPGEGYWVRMLGVGTTSVRLDPGSQPVKLQPTDIFTSPVRAGWNQVGNPSPYTVPVRELRFQIAGGRIIDFDQALSSRLIGPALFEYNRKTGRYVQLSRESLVRPGQGIWLFSFGERNVVWPAPRGPQIQITP